MIIIHCLKTSDWSKVSAKRFYGEKQVKKEGFINCSEITTFSNVAPNFKEIAKPLTLLCIDTRLVTPEIKWEADQESGRKYPHIYGALNTDAIVRVLPYLKDKNGDWVINKELIKFQNEDI